MLLYVLALMCGLVSLVSGAAVLPARQAGALSANSTPCGVAETATVSITTTVYLPPKTITMAVENGTSVSASLSSAASIDSLYVSEQSELAPVSEPVPTSDSTFVHTIVVPLVEATAGTNSTSGVYYVSIGPNSTDWSYTPTQSTVVGTTTVTVIPVPTSSQHSVVVTASSTTYTTRTTMRTQTITTRASLPVSTGTSPVGGLFTSSVPKGPYGWNATSHSTRRGGTAGSSEPPPRYNTTVTDFTTVATVTVNVAASPSFNVTMTSTSTCNDQVASGASDTSENINGKRQICTLVYATIDNNLASWCNNWDGSTVFHESTYTSTFTPFPYGASSTPSPAATQTPAGSSALVPTRSISLSSTTGGLIPAAATSCGQVGLFEINFDGLPVYSPANNDTANYPPIFNPYEHFFWGNGWAYGPPPTEPFPPQSGDHVAEYIPSLATNSSTSPDADTVPQNAFGCGPRAYNNNYWFNAESVYVGCDNGATDPSVTCDFVATGYRWDPVNLKEDVWVTEHFPQPPCPDFKGCQLNQVFLNSQFTELSSLSFYAIVQGIQVIFWIDTMELSWYNNTCAAGLARASSQ